MKKLIILGVFFLATLCFAQEQRVYHNDEGHFSFTVPDGWTEFSQEETDAQSNAASQYSGKNIRYIAVFRKVGREIDRPIISILIDSAGRMSENEIQQIITSREQQGIINKKAQEYTKDFLLDFDGLTYDKERKILFQKIRTTADGTNHILINAMPMSKYGFITIGFGSTEENFDSDVKNFNAMIESFKFDKDYEY